MNFDMCFALENVLVFFVGPAVSWILRVPNRPWDMQTKKVHEWISEVSLFGSHKFVMYSNSLHYPECLLR